MGLVSISIRTHFLAFNNFPLAIPEPIPITSMTPSRRRVLFTFGTLIITILQNVLERMHISSIQNGKNAKFIHGIKHQSLSILSFFDDHILIIEDLVEKLFPSSTRVFDKVDDLVKVAESFPLKFDEFIDYDIRRIMQRVPFLCRVFKKDEKEIVIDIACHGYRIEPGNSFEDVKQDSENETFGEEVVADISKTMSNVSDDFSKENDNMEDANGEFLYSARANSYDDINQTDDQIFELFETGWHKSPRALSNSSSFEKASSPSNRN